MALSLCAALDILLNPFTFISQPTANRTSKREMFPRRNLLALGILALTNLAAGQQISSGCNSFLSNLDADPILQECTSKLLNATSSFNPTSNTTRSPSLSAIQTTLVSVCQNSIDFCDLQTLATVLNAFAGNCTAELTGQTAVASVVSLYDAIYLVKPLKDAMCTTNSNTGNSCLLEIAGTSNSSAAQVQNATVAEPQGAVSNIAPANSTVRTYLKMAASFDVQRYAGEALVPANLYVQADQLKSGLKKRWDGLLGKRQASASASATGTRGAVANDDDDDPTAGIVTANATTFQKTYLPFLFLSPAMPSAQLCQPCTQAVMASYVAFENAVPYAGGLPNSFLLAGQASFWKSIGASCGANFLSEINTKAGTNSDQFSSALSLSGVLLGIASAAFISMATLYF